MRWPKPVEAAVLPGKRVQCSAFHPVHDLGGCGCPWDAHDRIVCRKHKSNIVAWDISFPSLSTTVDDESKKKTKPPNEPPFAGGFKENEVVGNLTEFTGRGRRLYATYGPSLGRRHLLSRHQSSQRADRGIPIRTVITTHLS